MKVKHNKGITLIALIVTIVVLMILAGIAIGTIVGNEGLIIRTQNAKNMHVQGEQLEMNTMIDYENLIEDVTGIGSGSGNGIGSGSGNGGGSGSGNGGGSGSGNGGGSGEGGDSSTGTSLSTVAKIGQLVNYDPTLGGNATAENTTYTSVAGSTTEHGNGYTDDADGQKFSAQNYKNDDNGIWRILDIDESGTITLISNVIYQDNETTGKMSSTGLYIYNGVGYLWAEEELHRIASIYGHGKGADTSKTITCYYGGPNDQDTTATGEYALTGVEAQQGRKKTLDLDSGARALTVEDINTICAAKQPLTKKEYGITFYDGTVSKGSGNAKFYPTLNAPEGNETTGESEEQTSTDYNGKSYYKTYYSYTISSVNSEFRNEQNSLLKLGENYWLASRCIYPNTSSTAFDMFVVNGNDVIAMNPCLCNLSGWQKSKTTRGIRVVVTLQSGIKTTDTEYNDSTGWNLAD